MKKIFLILLYIFTLLIPVSFWFEKNAPYLFIDIASFLISFGKLFGLLTAFSVLVQLMLMGRIKWIETVVGHDKLAKLHRKHGNLTFVFMCLHFTFILVGHSNGNIAVIRLLNQLKVFIYYYEDVVNAFIAFCIFILTVGLSITIARTKVKYETWYYVHLLNYVAITLAFGHQLEVGSDFINNPNFVLFWYGLYIFVTSNFIFYRFVLPIYKSLRHGFRVSKVQKENNEVTSIYIGGRNLDKFKIKPGQFVIVRFLAKGFWYEAHPFSISSYPNNEYVRLTIKNDGDFTSRISNLKIGTKILVDGPHGTFTADNSTKDKLLLIAGGIGITPIRSILERLLALRKDVFLMYSMKTKNDFVFKDEIEILSKNHTFQKEFLFTDENKQRIDLAYIKAKVEDLKDREIFICGPKTMIKSVSELLVGYGINKSLIHYEIFEL